MRFFSAEGPKPTINSVMFPRLRSEPAQPLVNLQKLLGDAGARSAGLPETCGWTGGASGLQTLHVLPCANLQERCPAATPAAIVFPHTLRWVLRAEIHRAEPAAKIQLLFFLTRAQNNYFIRPLCD